MVFFGLVIFFFCTFFLFVLQLEAHACVFFLVCLFFWSSEYFVLCFPCQLNMPGKLSKSGCAFLSPAGNLDAGGRDPRFLSCH